MKIDNIALIQQFSLSIFPDFWGKMETTRSLDLWMYFPVDRCHEETVINVLSRVRSTVEWLTLTQGLKKF